ncbi:protein phosphatase 2C domain-containing protein [Leptotrichia trevisanii]
MRKDEAKFVTNFFSEAGTRSQNNDYFGYVQLDNYAIWVISDGYDAEEGAAIAAKLAVESAIEYFMLRPRFNTAVIKEMIDYANLKIKERQEETERYSLMHTSLLIVISNYNAILYGNVGNTRLYHMRGGYIISQSRDDSIAQLLVDEGALDTRDIKFHRQRNDLLQAIGDFGKIKPNIIRTPITLQENDILCLTTIGFWENIDEREMEVELSRQPDQKSWMDSLEKSVIATLRDEVENYTMAAVKIEKVASPEPIEKDQKRFWIKIGLISLGILLIILVLTFWNINKRNSIMKRATNYEQQADDELVKKNFNNSVDDLKLVIGEYERLKPKSRGIIGFFVNANARRTKVQNMINNVKNRIVQTEKLAMAFQNINQGNELFNNGRYDDATQKYQSAKFILSENSYKRDELNTNEVLTTLDSRIQSASKLKEAQAIETAGNQAFSAGNFNLAKENYKTASEMYLTNGRADYVTSIERKIAEINEKEKTAYNGAMLTENRGDLLSTSDTNKSREAYYQARQMYQTLGDTVKTQEIDNKIQELNSKQMSSIQTANNLVQEGLNHITANKPAEAITLLSKAKTIYQELGDSNNVANANKFIAQAQDFIKLESQKDKQLKDVEKRLSDQLKEQQIKSTQQLQQEKIQAEQKIRAKEAEIEAQRNAIEQEKQRREKIAENIQNATNLEIQAEQMFNLKRYTESITKYNESKQIFETLKASGDFDDQTNKIEYLSQKISKVEGYLYEEQGDEEYKKKNWQESVKKYQVSLDDMKLVGESNEIQKRVEKKLKKATSKANKKWWQFWK